MTALGRVVNDFSVTGATTPNKYVGLCERVFYNGSLKQ